MGRMEVNRRLAAVLSADVAGYSRLMQDDDRATLETLTERRAVFAEKVAAHGGRIVNAPGDAVLAEFAATLDAVECAIAIQRMLAGANAPLPETRRMQFRIGVNLGDVLVDDNGIYGDGVNVAARLESLAPAGGICISGAVWEQVRKRVGLDADDLGGQSVKNIADPVRVFRLRLDSRAAVPIARARQSSIAVLPFENMTGDAAQDPLCDGISDDIITGLSKVNGVAVMGRISSFAYRGRAADVRRIGQELGVRYVVTGSVRRGVESLRIAAQLVDAETGAQLWAHRYDRAAHDLFHVVDEVAEDIVISLDVKLSRGEEARVWQKSVKTLTAREVFSRAMSAYYRSTPSDVRIARELFTEALELEPETAMIHSQIAATHAVEVMQGWTADVPRSIEELRRAATRALELDPTVAGAHVSLGMVDLFEGRHDQALARMEHALDLRPMCAGPRAFLAYADIYSDRLQDAIVNAREAVEFNPVSPSWYRYLMGAAEHFGGHHDDAVTILRQVREASPRLLPARLVSIAAHTALGREDAARAEAAALLRDSPAFSVARFATTQPFRDAARRDRYLEMLRASGLPD